MKSLLAAIVDFFIPPFCVVCGNRQRGWPSTPVCDSCWSSFLQDDMGGRMPVPGKSYSFTRFRARFLFTEELQKALHALKYKHMPSIGRRMGWEMGASVPIEFWSSMDGIVAVPLYHTRKRERGYNQADMIAKGLFESTGLEVIKKAMKRIRDTGTQTKLNKENREVNVEGAFIAFSHAVKGKKLLLVDDVATAISSLMRKILRKPYTPPKRVSAVAGKRILLVDDVVTTGSTCDECARALLAAGALEVRVVSAARA
jgi:ComF family protein